MFSRTEIPILPSFRVGILAAMPWLALAVFNLALTLANGFIFPLLALLALGGAVYQWKLNGGLRLERSITCLILTGDGLVAQQRKGDRYPVSATPASRLYPRLAILKLCPADSTKKPSTVLLFAGRHGAGNISADHHRRLRAWLRLGPSGDGAQ